MSITVERVMDVMASVGAAGRLVEGVPGDLTAVHEAAFIDTDDVEKAFCAQELVNLMPVVARQIEQLRASFTMMADIVELVRPQVSGDARRAMLHVVGGTEHG